MPPAHPFRGRIHVTTRVSSTQDLARRSKEIPSVWVADIQTAGRGRQGHLWISDQPLGLWCSVLLAPTERQLPLLGIIGTLAAADAVRILTGLETVLKWPNDLLCRGRKLAGLLVETVARPGHPPLAILGLGLNLAQQAGDFPRELKATAISLRQAGGRPVPRTQMLAAFLEVLTRRMDQTPAEIVEDFNAAWGDRGRSVEILSGGCPHRGVADHLDDSGHLHLRLADGSEKVFASGEINFPA